MLMKYWINQSLAIEYRGQVSKLILFISNHCCCLGWIGRSVHEVKGSINKLSQGRYMSVPTNLSLAAQGLVGMCHPCHALETMPHCCHRNVTSQYPWHPALIVSSYSNGFCLYTSLNLHLSPIIRLLWTYPSTKLLHWANTTSVLIPIWIRYSPIDEKSLLLSRVPIGLVFG